MITASVFATVACAYPEGTYGFEQDNRFWSLFYMTSSKSQPDFDPRSIRELREKLLQDLPSLERATAAIREFCAEKKPEFTKPVYFDFAKKRLIEDGKEKPIPKNQLWQIFAYGFRRKVIGYLDGYLIFDWRLKSKTFNANSLTLAAPGNKGFAGNEAVSEKPTVSDFRTRCLKCGQLFVRKS